MLQGLEGRAEAALAELREGGARAAHLQQQVAAAQERAAAARHRVPELEALKKAAAAARVRTGDLINNFIEEGFSSPPVFVYSNQ